MARIIRLWPAFLVAAMLGYCALPLKSFVSAEIVATDQYGARNVTVSLLDASGTALQSFQSGRGSGTWKFPSWWGDDQEYISAARRTAALRLEAQGCENITMPASFSREYDPFCIPIHCHGQARFLYTLKVNVRLECR